jgi:hypothetical protein
MEEFDSYQEDGLLEKLCQGCRKISLFASGAHDLTKCLFQMIAIFLALFFFVSIYLFHRHLSSRIVEGINQLKTFCEQVYTKLKEAYQAVISFCDKIN